MARVNTYRLTSRYAPATQELGEEAFQIDARYAVNKKLSFLVNYAFIMLADDFWVVVVVIFSFSCFLRMKEFLSYYYFLLYLVLGYGDTCYTDIQSGYLHY